MREGKPQYKTLLKTLQDLHDRVVDIIGANELDQQSRRYKRLLRAAGEAEQVIKRAALALKK